MKEPLNMMLSSCNRDSISKMLYPKDCAMAFTNEYVPKLEDEKSEFFRAARAKFSSFVTISKWTVDRDRNMVLLLTGSGRDFDSQDEEYWSFLDGHNEYSFMTRLLESREISETHIYLKRSIRFNLGSGLLGPNSTVLQYIKEALSVRKDFGITSRYQSCELVLVSEKGEVL